MADRLHSDFFRRDVLEVAPDLIGAMLIRKFPSGGEEKFVISEVEAYRGIEDKACHASKGKTPRTEVMFRDGGLLYMYLIYGMYWMMNIVTADAGNPQAVLIRGVTEISGPGRLTRRLELDRGFNGEDLSTSGRIWIERTIQQPAFYTTPRINIDYAGDYWRSKPWRYVLADSDYNPGL